MKKKIKEGLRHPLILGSAVIFSGSLLGSFINFIFNLFMTRNLSVSDYGILASIVSLITLSTLPAGAVVPMVINFAASYFAKGEFGKVSDLFFKVVKFLFFLGAIAFAIFLIFRKDIGHFFNIYNESLIVLTGIIVLTSFTGIVNSALLQARLSFKFITFSNLLASFLKLFLGAILVFFGFAIGGVIWALFLSSLIPYLISFIPLGFIFKNRMIDSKADLNKLFAYGAPAALTMFGLTSLTTTDIVLVKHFFDPKSAGIYAGLSLIGRVIFFFSAPIGTVMFPLVVQKHAKKENYHNTFKLSLFLVFLPSILITIFYFIFPEFSIKFFIKRDEYLPAAPLLGIFGIFITLFSLLSIMTNFYLSIKKTKISMLVAGGAFVQAALIWFFHKTFFQIIIISLSVISLLLAFFLLYYWKLHEGQKNK